MSLLKITSDSNNLLINKPIVSQSINIDTLNVSDEIYLNSNIYTPVGSILTYAGSSAPGGWLLCDGSEVSKTTYSRLFSVIGNNYGSASSPTSFVLPNLADRIPVGKSGSTSLGNTGGNSSITLSVGQLPSHTHTGTTASDGLHTHSGSTDISGSHSHSGTTNSDGSHSHGITDPGHVHTQTTHQDDYNSFGGNPPSFAGDAGVNVVWSNINSATTGITINSGGSHSHGFTSNTGGSHQHPFTTNSGGSHNHSFTTAATGSGNSVDIRNKYVIMNYIIRY